MKMKLNLLNSFAIVLFGLFIEAAIIHCSPILLMRIKFRNFEGRMEEILARYLEGDGSVILEGIPLSRLGIDSDFSMVHLIQSERVSEFYIRGNRYVFAKSPSEESLMYSMVLQDEGRMVCQLDADWWLLKGRRVHPTFLEKFSY